MKTITGFYIGIINLLLIYSFGFVDPNLILSTHPLYQKFYQPLFELVFFNRPLSTLIFILIILLFNICYLLFLWLAAKKKLTSQNLKLLLGITVVILVFSFPAFSYDIFNYIFTAKVAYHYGENPYLMMPIEFMGDPNLIFTRAANKVALYGPSWIGLTAIPYFLGFGNIVATIFSFKLFMAAFYLGVIWLIWKISKNIFSVALFALNPLVVVETLVSSHNDIVMMFFALLAFYLLKRSRLFLASLSFFLAIFIKYTMIILLPIFIFILINQYKRKIINWDGVFHVAAWMMFILILLVAPIREEIYPWYVIWILAFAPLVIKRKLLILLTITLSLSAMLRYVPVIYTGSYMGITPLIKELVTFIPLSVVVIFWIWKKSLWQKYFR